MPFKIVRNDITKMQVDAIVNPTNEMMYSTAGVDGFIHKAEGDWLKKETSNLGKLNPGEVQLTKAKKLPSDYIIHTVGPIWVDGNQGEEEILRSCYIKSLKLAVNKGFESIAFPLIASGTYGYPKDRALETATATIGEFLLSNDLDVYLVVYDRKSFLLSEKLYQQINEYIDDNYVKENNLYQNPKLRDRLLNIDDKTINKKSMKNKKERKLEDILDNLGESFVEMLFRLIDEKDLKDPEVYKKANISRQTFSKIRTNEEYTPKKPTIIALAIALELNLDETKDLLRKAGYALTNNDRFDVIIKYFIENEDYNIFKINEVLFDYDESLLI